MTSSQATDHRGRARSRPPGSPRMPAPPSRCPARRSRWAPRPASTWASRARTSRSPPASPTASPCACSTRPARKPRSRCRITTPMSGMRSCRESARGRPTGTASAAPGTRPGACGATRPSCCSTPTPRRSAERSRSGRRCSARTRPTPAKPSTLDSAGHVPRSLVVDPAVRLAGRPAALAPLRGHGPVRGPRQGLHHAPPGHPAGAARDLRRAGPRGRHRAPASTWASPPSNCCPCTRTCPRRSWSAGA